MPMLSNAKAIKHKNIELKEYTAFTLYLVPDLATRLVFPFSLNESSNIFPFDAKLINTDIFDIKRSKETKHNTLLVSVKTEAYLKSLEPNKDYVKFLGTLYVNVGEYNLTIRLITTDKLNKHYDDIIFDMSKDKRNYLIESEIQNKLKEIEENNQDALNNIDELALQKSTAQLAKMALSKPKRHKIYENKNITLNDGGSLEIDVDRFIEYPFVNFLVFEVANETSKNIKLNSFDLLSTKKKNTIKTFITEYYCPDYIKAESSVKCALIFHDKDVFKAKELTLKLGTDRGEAKIIW